MHSRRRWIALLALAAASCRPGGPPPPIPREMTACVPPNAVLIAGARLDTIRASPIYAHLPVMVQEFLQPLKDATEVLATFDGGGILLIARGHFREATPAATLVPPDLMLSGPPALIEAARTRLRSRAPVQTDLLAQASAVASGHAAWIATRGGVPLPLTGDAENLTHLLRIANFATVGLRLESTATAIDFDAQCATPDSASNLEETLRAFLSLSAVGLRRQPDLAEALRSAQVRREGATVHASISASPEAITRLLDFLRR